VTNEGRIPTIAEAKQEADRWCSEVRVVKDEGCDCQDCEAATGTGVGDAWAQWGCPTPDEMTVVSCPECGQVTDIDYSDMCDECRCAPGQPHAVSCPAGVSHLGHGAGSGIGPVFDGSGEHVTSCVSDAALNTTDVPFRVQEWCFEELAAAKLDMLHRLIDVHGDTILEMARDRFRKGYARYGSTMYGWTVEERLRNALEELADAVCYLTSGPVA